MFGSGWFGLVFSLRAASFYETHQACSSHQAWRKQSSPSTRMSPRRSLPTLSGMVRVSCSSEKARSDLRAMGTCTARCRTMSSWPTSRRRSRFQLARAQRIHQAVRGSVAGCIVVAIDDSLQLLVPRIVILDTTLLSNNRTHVELSTQLAESVSQSRTNVGLVMCRGRS